MKRFHVHVAVDDLDASIRFYSSLFGTAPSVRKTDYAKWMLDDPRVNFAISARGASAGVDHLGIQVETESELEAVRTHMQDADAPMIAQSETTCCYAVSNKHWITDPQGIAWEAYHTLDSAPTFGASAEKPASAGPTPAASSCCGSSAAETVAIPVAAAAGGSCCGK